MGGTDGSDFSGALPVDVGLGPVLPRFKDVTKIAVLRGTGLGDLMLALPAFEALAVAYPEASITLLGTDAHAALLNGRPGPISRVEPLPYSPGIRDGGDDPDGVEKFLARMRTENFDLAIQLQGGGRNTNPFLLGLNARHTVGARTPDAPELQRSIPYAVQQHETFRTLEVVGLAGASPVSVQGHVPTTPAEREAAAQWLGSGDTDTDAAAGPGTGPAKRLPAVALHPGATDPRRRWPTSSFARLAAKAVEDGCQVLLVGDDGVDKELADDIMQQAKDRLAPGGGSGLPDTAGTAGTTGTTGTIGTAGTIRSAAGQLSLGELAAVLEASAVVVANDSGPRHIAQAVGTPTVGIYWVGNVLTASPLGRSMHRIHISWATQCPVCGIDVTRTGKDAARCEHDFPLTADIHPDDVYADLASLRAMNLLLHGK